MMLILLPLMDNAAIRSSIILVLMPHSSYATVALDDSKRALGKILL